jgi:hypothetical protein
MSNRVGPKAQLIRLVVLLILGAAGAVIAVNMKSPLAVSESEVRRMVKKHELIGQPLADVAKKLQHQSPGTTDGTVVFDFDQFKDWKAGSLQLDVIGGKVTAATWISPNDQFQVGGSEGSDVRQVQGDGANGGAAQGQGASQGIRAKNQGTGLRGPR